MPLQELKLFEASFMAIGVQHKLVSSVSACHLMGTDWGGGGRACRGV